MVIGLFKFFLSKKRKTANTSSHFVEMKQPASKVICGGPFPKYPEVGGGFYG